MSAVARASAPAAGIIANPVLASTGSAVSPQVRTSYSGAPSGLLAAPKSVGAIAASKPLGSIDRAKLNVKGGSLAAGHPFAATGPRIVANLAKALSERGGGRGLISICAAGGQGVVAILEA